MSLKYLNIWIEYLLEAFLLKSFRCLWKNGMRIPKSWNTGWSKDEYMLVKLLMHGIERDKNWHMCFEWLGILL